MHDPFPGARPCLRTRTPVRATLAPPATPVRERRQQGVQRSASAMPFKDAARLRVGRRPDRQGALAARKVNLSRHKRRIDDVAHCGGIGEQMLPFGSVGIVGGQGTGRGQVPRPRTAQPQDDAKLRIRALRVRESACSLLVPHLHPRQRREGSASGPPSPPEHSGPDGVTSPCDRPGRGDLGRSALPAARHRARHPR
jgi:hypothetical protein